MPPCYPLCRWSSHPASQPNTLRSIYRLPQWKWKTFLTLAQGHAVIQSENTKDSVLVDLYLKARLFQVLNQVGVKSWVHWTSCYLWWAILSPNTSKHQKFRWNLKVVQLCDVMYLSKAKQNGWEEDRATRKNTCLQDVISIQLGMGPLHYRKHKAVGNLSQRSKRNT